MSNLILEIRRDAKGQCALFQNNKIVTLVVIEEDVQMQINIGTGFDAGAQVSGFHLFNKTNSTKGSSIGIWNRTDSSSQPSTKLSIAEYGSGSIVVADTNCTDDDAYFFFGVQVSTDGKTTCDTDPELRVKKRTLR